VSATRAITYAFASLDGALCGVARLGEAEGRTSGLVLVFRGGEPVAVSADGEGPAGLTVSGDGPWSVAFEGDVPFALEFAAAGEPLVLAAGSAAAKAGGMEGSDVVCRVSGTVGGEPFEGLGQRGESWGDPDWEKMVLARTLTAWFEDGRAISAVAVRGEKASSHADEAVTAMLLDADGTPLEIADPRWSTTYDGDERQRAAGLELYVGAEDDFALRAAGEVVAGTTLDLGRLRLDCAFFRWRMQGRSGVGRYDVLKRAS
jgi:hypothetical protein